MKGKFIVIEGLDGSGKTTQSNIITDYLISKGCNVVRCAEPTNGFYGKLCREYLGGKPCEKSLFATVFTADRIDHNLDKENGIKANLEKGNIIICDRYYYSSLAYQGMDVDINWVYQMNINCPDITKPDLCIFLDLEPEISLKRITENRKAEDIEIYENIDSLTKIRNKFKQAISMLAHDNIAVINADGTIEEISSKILTEINKIL